MKGAWWKITALVLIAYTIVGGLLLEVPRLDILNETIRNLYFHVPMWFGMIIVLLASMVYSIKYLKSQDLKHDLWAAELANTGILFGVLGIVTGMIWAKFTWGAYWSGDPKQNGAAGGLMFYLGYVVLRGAFKDEEQRARISAISNIFAFAIFIPLIFVLPRLTDSLHPGNGGNPGFNAYDLDSKLRLIFYPAIIGWTLLGVWFTSLNVRMRTVENQLLEKE
ncbi:cytochrome c biogenesis protein CcsA [Flammeovirga aprica]|uniref:Heme exporter protein C n=1 Tax=Flammeovirga aprica JL-4 TaxID=694437 RepID=A0A7X9RWB9_9BACT|nr:cytochrome c biogenesis protein CcsA [Flammeovirga aprica]NME69908.1 cytochrome c biogenesis protein CcsA [Flammeovirga aprica JL-4]